ncbi:MAG: hypothetical protein ACLR0U_20275 [Enterocloster clostridioformis]
MECDRKTYKMGCKLERIKSRIRSFGSIMRKRIVIIGGGAFGTGLRAIGMGQERGSCDHCGAHGPGGRKSQIRSTGNGRCNLTNLRMGEDCYRCGQKGFPWKLVRGFGVDETLAF